MTAEPKKIEDVESHAPNRKLIIRLALGVVLLIVLVWGLIIFVHSFYYESTDDAFVEGHVVTVGTKLSNIVQDVLIDDNYEVKKGQLLVQIDPRDYQVQLDAAQASNDKAKADFDRDVALANSSAISRQDLDTTRAAYDVAKSQLDQAKLNLEYTRITAPVDGRITRKAVEPGDYIQTGQTLFSIVPARHWIIAISRKRSSPTCCRDNRPRSASTRFPARSSRATSTACKPAPAPASACCLRKMRPAIT